MLVDWLVAALPIGSSRKDKQYQIINRFKEFKIYLNRLDVTNCVGKGCGAVKSEHVNVTPTALIEVRHADDTMSPMADDIFYIHLRNGENFSSKAEYAAACGYSLSYILKLRRSGLGWDAIWNRKRNGTPAQKAKAKRRMRRINRDMSLFEPVEE